MDFKTHCPLCGSGEASERGGSPIELEHNNSSETRSSAMTLARVLNARQWRDDSSSPPQLGFAPAAP